MKTKFSLALPVLLLLLSLNGCKKFLDTEPEGRLVLTKLEDYELLLNGPSLSLGDYRITDFMTDDVDDVEDLITGHSNPTIESRIYLWADQFDLTTTESPVFWGAYYANIYAYNVVIQQVENASTGTLQEKQKLKAEAMMRRAFEYLCLINLYAKPYDPLTANSTPGVPYVTSTNVSDQTPPRSSVGVIYQKIIDDLINAIPNLADNNNGNKFRGSVNAAYSILARTYYYMNNYTEASKYATLTLSESGTGLLDYNSIKVQEELPLISISKQEIYARNSNSTNYGVNAIISQHLQRLLKNGDLRFRLFYRQTELTTFPSRGSTLFTSPIPGKISFGTSVPEMKLIIAEAAALDGNLSTALEQLNDIRKARTDTSDYTAFSSADVEIVLQQILTERRIELAFRGIRWTDMRKLDAANKMPEIIRQNFNGETITALKPHSIKYILKIPASILSFNPGMPQN